MLDENWKDLPSRLGVAHHIEINVNWSERAGVRRVANNSDPELVVDGVAASLPYHVCLSELLFGEPLYRQRREMLGPGASRSRAHPSRLREPVRPTVPSRWRLPARVPRAWIPPPSSAPTSGAPAVPGPTKPDPKAHPTVTGKKD